MPTSCVFMAVYNGNKALAVHAPVIGNYDQLYLNIYNNGIKVQTQFCQANNSLIGILHDVADFNVMIVVSGTMDEKILGDFLNTVKSKFMSQFGARWKTAEHLEFQDSFKSVFEEIQRQIESGAREKIQIAKQNLDESMSTMKDNLRNAIIRGEALNDLDEDAQEVETKSVEFNVQSTKLKHYFWWNRYRWVFFGILAALVVIYLLVVIACGGFNFKPRCIKSSVNPEPQNQHQFQKQISSDLQKKNK